MSLQTRIVAPAMPEALPDTITAMSLHAEATHDKKDLHEAMDILDIAQE